MLNLTTVSKLTEARHVSIPHTNKFVCILETLLLKRREKKKKLIQSYTKGEWLQKLKDSFGICNMCNKYVGIIKLTMDHIIPISKAKIGQVYTINDVQPLCLSCNCKKNNKIIPK